MSNLFVNTSIKIKSTTLFKQCLMCLARCIHSVLAKSFHSLLCGGGLSLRAGESSFFARGNLGRVMLGGRHLLRLAGTACWWACLACLCESDARAVGLVAIYCIYKDIGGRLVLRVQVEGSMKAAIGRLGRWVSIGERV